MKFLQIVDSRKAKNVIRDKCMQSVKRFVTEKDEHIIKEISFNTNICKMVNEADRIRFTYAKQNDDLLYIDTDCFLNALPSESVIKSKKIILAETMTNEGLKPDIFLFYVNGNKDFFLKNYEAIITEHETFSLSPNQLRLFYEHWASYDFLSYCHYSLSSLELGINNQFNLIQNKLIDAEKEINSYRNSIQGMIQITELYNRLREKVNNNG